MAENITITEISIIYHNNHEQILERKLGVLKHFQIHGYVGKATEMNVSLWWAFVDIRKAFDAIEV